MFLFEYLNFCKGVNKFFYACPGMLCQCDHNKL
jgi:hypothetical protein